MAAGDVTITRGVGARTDFLDTTATQQNASSVSGVTVTSNGDLLTWSGTFTNPTAQDGAIVYISVPSLSGTTYPFTLGRAQINTIQGNFNLTGYVHYTDNTSQINQPNLGDRKIT